MSARLQYAKVLDQYFFYREGGRVHPGLPNKVIVPHNGGPAAAFLVLRAWSDDHGTFTEQWRIEGFDGSRVYQSVPREIHMPTRSHTERLQDEVSDLVLQAAEGVYRAVFSLDDEEVGRVEFPIQLSEEDPPGSPS
ncbi:MAG: hypothetical protein M3454_09645 [Actinomycetota bacterium]|nr:hypothetical protein [Actinomycetota bacterium]